MFQCANHGYVLAHIDLKSLTFFFLFFFLEFFSSLCKCIEKHNQLIIQSQVNLTDVESNINDIEFLHSLIRFLKYVFFCYFIFSSDKT